MFSCIALAAAQRGNKTVAQKIYEGKAKILYTTDDPDVLLTHFKDDATAFNAQKRGTIQGKGEMNCAISTRLFQLLQAQDIPTHWIDSPSPQTMRVRNVTIIPLEVVVRNLAAGSLVRETGLPVGQPLSPPLVEFYYKNDDLGDPLLTRDRIAALALASPEQVDQLIALARQINDILSAFFERCNIVLVDFKLEFGLDKSGRLLLADEISPDTCRLWDQSVDNPEQRVMDKDRFRHDLGRVEAAYEAVMQRVLAQPMPGVG
ncbi:MAG: phosphoribosylaminoimidazolesuccinocarboxamide synthase [Elainellaceae cyanobacterium]